MYFLLVRRRERGIAIPNEKLAKTKPLRADVHIEYGHSKVLGRPCIEACVFNPTPSGDIIPPLHDACVNGMATLGMNITGLEEVDGVLYAQSWWCRAAGNYDD
ncbi:hypothetical protein [Pseudomonas sp. p1(2021b)]|uniref:hypothetical protein n=1 Tax=Pseudomonas sp. p1(2021b) TaxID=2874628 RepID=UPI003D2CF8A8